MCGVIAVISKKYHKDAISIFKQLLYVGALRGWDGAGLFKVGYNSCDVYKQPGPSSNLLHYLGKPPETGLYGDILVGHNRASTKGGNTIDNTHPFQEGHITLVHNGTIFNHKELANTEVDSHAICHYLTEHTPQELINTINGAFTLVWYDNKEKELRFLRNNDRPLWIIHTQDLTLLVSERLMGEWILDRMGIDIHNVEEVVPFTLYTIKKNNLHTIHKEVLTKPTPFTIFPVPKKKEEVVNVKKEEIKKKDKILSTTAKATQTILESLENRGLKKNDVFTAYCYNSIPLGENYKNFAIADFDMQEEVVFYSRIPFENENVSLIFKNLIDDPDNNTYLLFGTAVEVIRSEDAVGKITLNGSLVTKNMDNFLTGRCCSECGKPYDRNTIEQSKVFINQTSAGFIYKYTYVCPTCAK